MKRRAKTAGRALCALLCAAMAAGTWASCSSAGKCAVFEGDGQLTAARTPSGHIVAPGPDGPGYVDDELLAFALPGVTRKDVEEFIARRGMVIAGHDSYLSKYQLRTASSMSRPQLEEACAELASSGLFERARLNAVFALAPGAPLLPVSGDAPDAMAPDGNPAREPAQTGGEAGIPVRAGFVGSGFGGSAGKLGLSSAILFSEDPGFLDKDGEAQASGAFAALGPMTDPGRKTTYFSLHAAALDLTRPCTENDLMSALSWLIMHEKCQVIFFAPVFSDEVPPEIRMDIARETARTLTALRAGSDFLIVCPAGDGGEDLSLPGASGHSVMTLIDDPGLRGRIIVAGTAVNAADGEGGVRAAGNTGARVDLIAPGPGSARAGANVWSAALFSWGLNPGLTGGQVKKIICASAVRSSSGGPYAVIDAPAALRMAVSLKEKPPLSSVVGTWVYTAPHPARYLATGEAVLQLRTDGSAVYRPGYYSGPWGYVPYGDDRYFPYGLWGTYRLSAQAITIDFTHEYSDYDAAAGPRDVYSLLDEPFCVYIPVQSTGAGEPGTGRRMSLDLSALEPARGMVGVWGWNLSVYGGVSFDLMDHSGWEKYTLCNPPHVHSFHQSYPRTGAVEAIALNSLVWPDPVEDAFERYATTDALRLRTGPGTDHRIVVTLGRGTEVTAVARGDGWVFVEALVEHPSRYWEPEWSMYAYGWVSADYLRPVK